jgi:hypothetical protein
MNNCTLSLGVKAKGVYPIVLCKAIDFNQMNFKIKKMMSYKDSNLALEKQLQL